MKTRIYDIEDEDVLDTYFGEDAIPRPLAGLGKDHGQLIFSDNLSTMPQEGEIVIVNDKEYIVLLRIIYAASDEVELVVHCPHFEVVLSLS